LSVAEQVLELLADPEVIDNLREAVDLWKKYKQKEMKKK